MSNADIRAMVLGAVLQHPDQRVQLALRSLGIDDAWEAFASGHPSIPQPLIERWHATDPGAMEAKAERAGCRFITEVHAEWPAALADLGHARPWGLWVRGRALSLAGATRPVALVGARSCTAYGERTALAIAHGLGQQGTVVVSGGAYGIDAAAHRGALAAGTPTIAVLASGVDVPYPIAHSSLFDRIAEAGSIVSEAPPGAHPTRQRFLYRNRVIAALAYGTVVVEARRRSGALSTYAHARSLNRVLMAVPGPVDSPESAGTHALLQDDARLVTSAADVLDLVGAIAVRADDVDERGNEWDGLSQSERAAYEALAARRGASVDALLSRVAPPLRPAELIAALASLAQRGLAIEGLDGAWVRARSLGGAAA